ncbi:MAG: RIP metalloprotease RseP [Muribaculaceae bacterium]|nr:RIP metalloprotease RseP [Muribaculaceae bacterium]
MTITFWIKALQLLASLSLLVFVHELGHYTFARLSGTRVDKFYLFFNPWFTLFKYKPKPKPVKEGEKPKASWRDTEYGIGWLPLGGYCSIAGMVDETTGADEMQHPVEPWEFRAKPAWQRLLIMVDGVLFNFLAAIVIYCGLVYAMGEEFIPFENATEGMAYCESAHAIGFKDGDIPLTADGKKLHYYNAEDLQAMLTASEVKVLRNHKDTVAIRIPENFIFKANEDAENGQLFMSYRLPVVVSQTQPNMGAEKAGMKNGDRILAVNGQPTSEFMSFTAALQKNKNKTIALKLVRGGKEMTLDVAVDDAGKIGILLTEPEKVYETVTLSYNIFQSIPRGIKMGWDKLTGYVSQLKYVFTADGAKSLGGFGSIGNIFPERWDWVSFWSITAFLSVILAVMNILPIPILDGGYVLFLLIEVVTGWKPSDKFMNVALNIGFYLLIALLLFANGNDVYRFLLK